jgi:hypothetical protein
MKKKYVVIQRIKLDWQDEYTELKRKYYRWKWLAHMAANPGYFRSEGLGTILTHVEKVDA